MLERLCIPVSVGIGTVFFCLDVYPSRVCYRFMPELYIVMHTHTNINIFHKILWLLWKTHFDKNSCLFTVFQDFVMLTKLRKVLENSWSCHIFYIEFSAHSQMQHLIQMNNLKQKIYFKYKKSSRQSSFVHVAMLHFACENDSKLWGVKLKCGHHLWNK